MTNAKKYINKTTSGIDLVNDLSDFMFKNLGYYEGTRAGIEKVLVDFFSKKKIPILSEDEKAILRHFKSFYYIYRTNLGDLQLTNKEHTWCAYELYFDDDVFQFIKDGEEYPIEELLKEE